MVKALVQILVELQKVIIKTVKTKIQVVARAVVGVQGVEVVVLPVLPTQAYLVS